MPTLLVVEDDKHQRLLYEQELTEEGYRVLLAENAEQAMATLERSAEEIDLVVMDISMPGMDGIEALGRILSKSNKLPVILNTAYANYKDNFMTWSADAYVVKSSDLTELKEQIRETLDRRRQT